ncbi:hypothetical protein [Ramlibacter sp. WS9]|uniref:hypothetical protein n=1 Tax=Ramlibacter sp. WS9 TaxID=1882741 RepID=UPI001142BC9E|nr:hypothetical protein [Ramlibacter sp. WS9]ROZ75277.1 hypothetical protein EEB15_15035 [Ramlibacter sp. WS9]
MATFTFYKPIDMSLTASWAGYITNASPGNITISDNAGRSASYNGSFSYANNDLVGGTLFSYTESTNYSQHYSITGLSLSAVAVKNYVLSGVAMIC